MFTTVPATKFVGVIVTAFVLPVELFMIILTCPSEPAPNVTGAAAAVALTKVILCVNWTAVTV